jgi:hypothetical protein
MAPRPKPCLAAAQLTAATASSVGQPHHSPSVRCRARRERASRSTAAPAEFSTVARKAKPRRQGEVDRSCLSRVAGDPNLAATNVAVGSQDVDEGPARYRWRLRRDEADGDVFGRPGGSDDECTTNPNPACSTCPSLRSPSESPTAIRIRQEIQYLGHGVLAS